jgi:hypothetical protein
LRSSSACCLMAAFGSSVAWMRSRSTPASMVAADIEVAWCVPADELSRQVRCEGGASSLLSYFCASVRGIIRGINGKEPFVWRFSVLFWVRAVCTQLVRDQNKVGWRICGINSSFARGQGPARVCQAPNAYRYRVDEPSFQSSPPSRRKCISITLTDRACGDSNDCDYMPYKSRMFATLPPRRISRTCSPMLTR